MRCKAFRPASWSPSFSSSTIDNRCVPTPGAATSSAWTLAGLGGNVADIRPIASSNSSFDEGLPPAQGRSADLRLRLQGRSSPALRERPHHRLSASSRAATPICVALIFAPRSHRPDLRQENVALTNRMAALFRPTRQPQCWRLPITVPISRLVYPGGDTSLVSNLEYRIRSLDR